MDADWASDKTSRRSTSGGRDSWWRSPQLLDKEAKECCTVKLGKRAVRGHLVGYEIFGDPERVDGSWAQLQCHRRDRQSERHFTRDAVATALHQNMLV